MITENNLIYSLELIFILASMIFIFRIYLRTKRNICSGYLYQFFALFSIVLVTVLKILNESRFILIDNELKIFHILSLFVLAFSFWYLQSCFTEAEKELKRSKGLIFKVEKR